MADKGAILKGPREKHFMNILMTAISRFNFAAGNRLLVDVGNVSSMTTLTTVTTVTTITNLTNWALQTAQQKSQADSYQAYTNGPRRNVTR